MSNRAWRVLAHRPIEKLAANLWRVEGDLEGMPLKRVMTVAKRTDGALVVHNAIALDAAAMAELDAWGRVGFVLVPNGYHRLDARPFKDRYPDAKVLCPPAARKKVESVVPVDGVYADFPKDDDVRLELLDGVGDGEGVMVVRSPDGVTLVFNDAIFNMPHLPGVQGFVLRHLTQSSGGPRVSRVGKLFLVKDKRAFAAHVERLAEAVDLVRVIVSHHEMIATDPKGALKTALATL